jgi:hypothetical protein
LRVELGQRSLRRIGVGGKIIRQQRRSVRLGRPSTSGTLIGCATDRLRIGTT